eukprot:12257-Heterococcus_DN1.PRE.3
MDFQRSYYDILCVDRSASTAQIDSSYRRLSLQHHPDRGGDPSLFRALKKAHETLREPRLRASYDAFGPSLKPDAGSLIGHGVGKLLPLTIAASGGLLAQCLFVLGTYGAAGCFGSTAIAVGAGILSKRVERDDSVARASVVGVLLGHGIGLGVAAAARSIVRLAG